MFVLMVAAAAMPSCRSSPVAPSQTSAPATRAPVAGRVLFIGNSLTESNDLPAVVEMVSRQAGGTPISTARVVSGGFSLEDHWNQGTAQRRIAEGGWSIVVLQQEAAEEANAQFGRR